MLADESREFVSHLLHEEGLNSADEWNSITPIELGILSWHLESIYYYPDWWIEGPA